MKNSLLDNIWIINLDKSIDRIEKINKNFNSLGIKYNRFSAIYGKDILKKNMNKYVSFVCKNFLCNYGIIGCALSHIQLWKQLINSEEKYYVIFEDDIEINKDTINVINKLEQYIIEYSIDYLNLNCVNYGCTLYETKFKIDNYEFGKPLMPLQTNAYIVTKVGAGKLLKMIEKINYHLDFQILISKMFYDFNYYTSSPPLLKLTNNETTIGKNRTTLTLKILDDLNFKFVSWLFNVPIITINLVYEINILLLIILLLIPLNYYYFQSNIIFLFLILEFFLLHFSYF